MEKLIEILDILDKKYHFTDEEVEQINEALYGEDDEEMYRDEYEGEEFDEE